MKTILLLFSSLLSNIYAFSTLNCNIIIFNKTYDVGSSTSTTTALFSTNVGRKKFLSKVASIAISITASTTALTPVSYATLMDTSVEEVKTFKLGEKLSPEDAKKRFIDAMAEVDELIDNYTSISKGGGDAVRRYLGTVGVEKKMYGITKVVKELREEADDIVEYTELANEFEAYLYQAEGAAYQSLFVEHSSAKGTPESFLATARKDILQMRNYMGELATLLKL